jgi:hypothetical protein
MRVVCGCESARIGRNAGGGSKCEKVRMGEVFGLRMTTGTE